MADGPPLLPPLTWLPLQLLPSPEWLVSGGEARFGLRWQVTPLLYSFGRDRRASSLRTLVVEPLVRHGGSIELFVSPEYLRVPADSRWGARVGIRTYLPLIEKGEGLSLSFGTSYLRLDGEGSAAFEIGAYTFLGILGVQAAYSPTLLGGSTLFTLSVRYF